MVRLHPRRLGWILVLTLGLMAVTAQAKALRYQYVSLRQHVEVPAGFSGFRPVAITNSGRVYGNVSSTCSPACLSHVAVYADGAVTVFQPGLVSAANDRGTIGGSVQLDPNNDIQQAALFHGDQVELIPPQPGESTSAVAALNEAGMALVISIDAVTSQQTVLLYQHGRTTPLDFGLPDAQTFDFLHLNNRGIIAGTFNVARGFRFDMRTGKTMQLDPLPTEPFAYGQDLNNRGEVLGISWGGVPYIERIGVWDRHGAFEIYVVQDINSSGLLFNDRNLIVITGVSSPPAERGKSYLVPEPGVRVNLADLVENLPVGLNLSTILDINNHGDMIGRSVQGFVIQDWFLLERTGRRERKEHGHR
jgi:hypothetical protein